MADILLQCINNRPYKQDHYLSGDGICLPENHILSRAFSLMEPHSNNVVEYNILLIGLQLAQQMGVQRSVMKT